MSKLNIGVGGIPLTSSSNATATGIKRVRELGLDLMEMEYVHGVKMTEDTAMEVRKVKEDEEIELTVHGPYYINLASSDNRIFYGSIKHITDSVFIGGLAGASSVTFHPAFYQKNDKRVVYDSVKKALEKIYSEFEKPKFENHSINKKEIVIAPELTGKPTQFGDIDELIELAGDFMELDLRFCIDFAHKYARSNGEFNGYERFLEIIENVEKNLGKGFIEKLHMHVSAINFGDKGEKNHLTFLQTIEEYGQADVYLPELEDDFNVLVEKGKTIKSDFKWQELMKVLKEKNVGGFLVCESPILELDALLLKKYYDNL